jgi:hypothetical protein
MTHHQEIRTGLSSNHGGNGLSKFKFGIGVAALAVVVAFGAFSSGAKVADASLSDWYIFGPLISDLSRDEAYAGAIARAPPNFTDPPSS